eukprot:CAMPEP_0172572860 /NCGR_PEP_ID=MMETSP1067-20121228/135897_1 /TAXON_ID=265564 ORGANISM="Thalassiosira punctigera, Strain Tpunct2005C2" /NCGR_SAMPLE_ID=MMETSP1067 /ASSEMBLY_ACC=CAM_ASM_000444 /LENGTH=59 /DNA_ID=CAMNT_0013365451 /DNA_START=414 /DNA_END=590 /DNA_ORIENTATION=+
MTSEQPDHLPNLGANVYIMAMINSRIIGLVSQSLRRSTGGTGWRAAIVQVVCLDYTDDW